MSHFSWWSSPDIIGFRWIPPLFGLFKGRRALLLLGACWPRGMHEAGSIPFIAVPSMPAFSTLAFVGFVAGSMSSAARLADGLRTEVSLVTFGTLTFAFPNAFTSISAGLWAFAHLTLLSFESWRANTLSRVKAGTSIKAGSRAVCFITVDAIESRWADTKTRSDAQSAIHAPRYAEGFLTVRPVEPIRTLTDSPFVTKASVSTPSRTFGLLTRFKEDSILRGLKDGVAFRIHDNHVHLKCCHPVLFAETRESNLNN